MASLEEILLSIQNLPIEVNNINYISIPQDRSIDTLSPINEINKNLQPFGDLIRIGHINAVKKHTPKHLYNIDGFKFFHVNRENKHCGGVDVLVSDLYASKAKKIETN